MTPGRLVSLGTVVVDVIATVGALPDRGSDVLADDGWTAVGGGYNVMIAARRQGMSVTYAGRVGFGPFGEMVAEALRADDIDHPLATSAGPDTGFVMVMVDAAGERTFVTVAGAEATLTDLDLNQIPIAATDSLVLSGYGLLHGPNRGAVLQRLDRLDAATTVFYDPGPLGPGLPYEVRARLAARADWFSCNEREALLLTGSRDIVGAASEIGRTLHRGGVIVRLGSAGCLLISAGAAPEVVPGFEVAVVDTNGAGDAHLGALVAALGSGLSPAAAARRANAAAAIAVTRRGPAGSPTSAEVDAFLVDHQ